MDKEKDADDSMPDLRHVELGESAEGEGNTTNLAFHLDHDHKEMGSTRGADVSPHPPKQTKIDEQFKKPTERMSATKQKEIDDALLKLIVGKVLPLSLVDHTYFRNFVMLLNPRSANPTIDNSTVESFANTFQYDRKNVPHGELKEEEEMVDIEDIEMNMVKVKALFIQPEIPREDWEYNRAVPEVEMMTVPSAGVTKLDMQRESEMESILGSSIEEMKEQSVPGMTDLKTIQKTSNRRQSRQDSVQAPAEAAEFLAEEGMSQGSAVVDSSVNLTDASVECTKLRKLNDPCNRFIAFLTRKREGEKTYCLNLTVARILVLMVILSSICGFILFLGLFPPSFVYVNYFEIGLRQSKLTNYLDRDTIYYPGCYVLGPDSTFLYFPTTAQEVALTIDVFTTDTVTITIKFSLHYFIRPAEVGKLHLKYGVDFDTIIRKVAVAVIKNNAAVGVTVEQFRFNRTALQRKFFNALRLKLEGNCCPNCCTTGCNGDSFCGLCQSGGSCHRGYYIDIHNFCLLDVKIPSEVSEHYLRRVILQVQAETEVFNQERAVLKNETAMLTQRFHNEANEIISNGSAVGDAIRTIATAEQEIVYQSAYEKALKHLYTTLGVTNESHKVSLMMIRTLEDASDNLYIGYGYNISYLYLN